MTPDYFYILDGHALLYRAHFASMMNLSCRCPECSGRAPKSRVDCPWCNNTGWEITKATFNFCKILRMICEDCKPAYLAIAMDAPRDTLHRKTIDPTYKSNRRGMPHELLVQKKRVRQIITALGVPMFTIKGWEADDVIGTLARLCVSDEVHIRIVSPDRDLWQLLTDPRVTVHDNATEEIVTAEICLAKLGVTPQQVVSYKAIAGDSGDHVRGVDGVGEKGAKTLLAKYGVLKNIIRRRFDIPGPLGRKIVEAVADGSLYQAEELVTVNCKLDVPVDPDKLAFNGLDWSRVSMLFRTLNFKPWA